MIKIKLFKAFLSVLFVLLTTNISFGWKVAIKRDNTLKKLSIENVETYLLEIGVCENHIPIILSQVVLETGWLQSNLCLNNNNLCGLYNSSQGEYYKFEHWTESIDMYYNNIYVNYSDTISYIQFIDNWGYAEDSLYIQKILSLAKDF